MVDNVELPWRSAQEDMEWECRVVSLKDIFPGDWSYMCGIKTWGQKKTSEGGGVGMLTPSPRPTSMSDGTSRSKEMANLPRGGWERQ